MRDLRGVVYFFKLFRFATVFGAFDPAGQLEARALRLPGFPQLFGPRRGLACCLRFVDGHGCLHHRCASGKPTPQSFLVR